MNLAVNTPPKSPIETLLHLAKADMAVVDDIIRARMQSPVGMIPDLAAHLVEAGGKRLRPLLTIASAHLCHYEGQQHYKLAAAVEFIHSATLLHDDVVDASDKRRGRKAANLIWGNAPSILVGDFLFARAFNLMVETGSMQALGILSNAASIIAEGEVQQLAGLRDIDMTLASYMDVISAKTATLFSAAAEVAPVLAASGETKQKALKTYGLELGLAFQIVDDVLDYGGLESALGKSVGDDFREGKMTLPVILAYAQAVKQKDTDTIAFWQRVIVTHRQTPDDLEYAIALLKNTGALAESIERAQTHVQAATDALSCFEDSVWRRALIDLAGFVVSRVS